jgi:hypothetical protein
MKHSAEFQKFTALVDNLLTVSHEEIQRREAEYRKQVDANPNRRGPKRKPKAVSGGWPTFTPFVKVGSARPSVTAFDLATRLASPVSNHLARCYSNHDQRLSRCSCCQRYRSYGFGEEGAVKLNQWSEIKINLRTAS